MNAAINIVIALAVLSWILARQLRTERFDERSGFKLPIIFLVAGLLQGGLIDDAHAGVSAALLATELVAAVAMGAVRSATMEIWRDEAGALWRRGTAWTAAAWVASMGVRFGLIGVGYLVGVRPQTGAIMVFLGATLITQTLLVTRRACKLPAAPATSPAAAPVTVVA